MAICLIGGTIGAVASASPAAAAAGEITTVAGGVGGPPSGNGGPSTAAAIPDPWGLKRVGSRLYVSEERPGLVRKIENNVIAPFVGGGTAPLGDGLKATEASFDAPQGVTFDVGGNLIVADTRNNRIRRVDAVTGVMATLAGNGTPGFSGDGGPATSAQLSGPLRTAVDSRGDLYISDSDNNRIRRVDAVTHIITTVAGNGSSGSSGDGGPPTAAGFSLRGIAFDPAGNLYLADVSVGKIRKITPGPDGVVNGGSGEIISTFLGGGTVLLDKASAGQPALAYDLPSSQAFPEGITFDSGGNLYVTLVGNAWVVEIAAAGNHALSLVAGNGTLVPLGPSGDGGPATDTSLDFPFGVAVDPAANVYFAELSAQRVRRVDAVTHIITTVAGLGSFGAFGAFGSYGDGGAAAAAPLAAPADVAFSGGNLFVVDRQTDRVRRIDANGIITTYAGGGVNNGPGLSAVLDHPRGLDADASGNLYVADCGDARVRKVTPAGVVSTVAGGGDHLDVGKATKVALGCPSDVAVVKSDPDAGTIYIADAADHKVRKVTPSGNISTVAGTGTPGFGGDGGNATSAELDNPQGVNLAPNADLLIADTGNNRVRRVDHATGKISTVAGNGAFGSGVDGVPATSTPVFAPTDVIADGSGNLYIAEAGFNRIRKVDPAGIITTLAGNGIPGFGGDGGSARYSILATPTQIEFDAQGALLFTDTDNGRIRRITTGTPLPPPTKGCGAVLTVDTTLTADVGPCPAIGFVVGADNITISLHGHRLFGSGPGDGSHPGILINNHTGVTVTGGSGSTVSDFDEGVAIVGGSNNTVKRITVHDNRGLPTTDSVYGDGIGIFFSAANTIVSNTITHNGIYTGIAVLGPTSDENTIRRNVISDTVDAVGGTGNGNGILINGFLSTGFPRARSIIHNVVDANIVENNDNSGVSNLSNLNGVVTNNIVRGNGRGSPVGARNGIGIQHLDFAQTDTHVRAENNLITGNHGGDGIQIAADQNTVRHNRVHSNDAGIVVTFQGHLNQIRDNDASNNAPDLNSRADLQDDNFTLVPFFTFNCDENVWRDNIWGSGGYFPNCVTIGGHPAPGGPPAPVAAADRTPTRTPSPPPPSVHEIVPRGSQPRPPAVPSVEPRP